MIQNIFRKVNQKANFVQKQLIDVLEIIEIACFQSENIRIQSINTLNQQETSTNEQLQRELVRIKNKKKLSIRLVYYQKQKFILHMIVSNAIMIVKKYCFYSFIPRKSNSKQKKFNIIYIREILAQFTVQTID